jgi:hypothetical protein
MAIETGDRKILGNFRRLIDLVAADALYRPGNAELEAPKLEARLAPSIAAVNDIGVKLAPSKAAINARQTSYTEAVALLRASRNILKASGASPETLADADTFFRKATGVRKSKKAEDNPETSENEASRNHSASQQSYDALLGHLRSYTEILRNEPLYAPTEAEFNVGALDTKADELEARNNAVSAAFVPLSAARALRDELLYTGEKCLCSLAQMVKAYVKAVHGADSEIYKAINALSFKRQNR